MTIQEMKDKKKEKGYSYAQISELSGVPLGTVQKIFTGQTENPRYETLQALEKLFGGEKHLPDYGKPDYGMQNLVREACPYEVNSGHSQGSYTVEDYRALPDERRVELIDGCFYDMAAPTSLHQKIAGEIYRQIANYIFDQGGACEVLISPIDVQLDCDEKTMVQPDVIIVCDPERVTFPCIYGAPDFVLEVVSPSSSKKDCIKKLKKYYDAGVREYWILDPEQELILVYDFSAEVCPKICSLNQLESLSVAIYEGKLEINLKYITHWIHSIKNSPEHPTFGGRLE